MSSTATGSAVPAPGLAPADQMATSELVDDAIACGACNSEITRQSLAVSRAGSHEHTFRNPSGFSWSLSCYKTAPGCGSRGDPTTKASWFDGYAWCYATCLGCGRHLGWWFVADDASFAGLIVTRLAS